MRYASFDCFSSFLIGRCVISYKDDLITLEDITNEEEESAARWQLLK
jgi:hypothetical protein